MLRLWVGLARWRSSLPLFSLSTAEKPTVIIRKQTNNLESSLHCGAVPVPLACLFATLFTDYDRVNARGKKNLSILLNQYRER